MSPPSIETLVRRSLEGDVDAYGLLLNYYHPRIYRLAYRMLRSREAAEDATQEVFIKAWQHLHQFQGASQFGTWLHSIASRHCLDLIRLQVRETHRTERFIDRLFPRGGAVFAPPVQEDWDLRLSLQDAIADLSEPHQIVVTLHCFAEYSLKEIAELLGTPLPTVRSRFYTALERLRSRLEDLER